MYSTQRVCHNPALDAYILHTAERKRAYGNTVAFTDLPLLIYHLLLLFIVKSQLQLHTNVDHSGNHTRPSSDIPPLAKLPHDCMVWCGSLQPNMIVDVDVHRLSIDSA